MFRDRVIVVLFFCISCWSCFLHGNGDYTMKDGGSRETYGSGAVRECRENKGRYDLISPIALRRLAIVCQKGAAKYQERNWEKGMPISRLLDSSLRHINQYIEGYRDEDHLAHAMWNLMAALHFDEVRPDLRDLHGYLPQPTLSEQQG